ncbi:S8 family serine peptidase [Desulfoscipio sp. XC116]|uniref:S8 family serine peptidase n=1 Tax=Desulfoscipio sp. XC116 TaxID=3144975 RepID=UPI00325AE0A5
MKKGRLKAFIAMFLALSLALATMQSPLSVNAKPYGGAASTAAKAASTVEDVYSGPGMQNGNSEPGDPQNQSVVEEIYAPILLDNLCDAKTDRFIIKFKNYQSKSTLANSISGDLKQIRNFKYHRFKNFSVVTTRTKMKSEDFTAKINSQNTDGEIEYIQPDYQLTAASLAAETTARQAGQNITKTMAEPLNESTDKQIGQLPEYLQGLSSDDPMVEQWLNTHQPREETPQNLYDVGTPVDLADVNLKAAWEKSRGEGTVIAVLDTGIDITHRDLAHKIWENNAETEDNGIDDDNNGYVDDINGWNFSGNNSAVHQAGREYDEWHGSHIAGIIAEVAPKAKIMPLKVFQNGTAYTSDIIEAIAYAERNGAQIANCSWETAFDNPALAEAIEKSAMLFVCAAGNSHTDIDISPVYPASYGYDNIITVASINKWGRLSGYSNYGVTNANVAAPGENIISSTPGDRYNKSSGTSQSAAFVAGEAALILGAHQNTNARAIKQTIIRTSNKLPDLAKQITNGNKINCGGGVSHPVSQSGELISKNARSLSVSESVYASHNDLSVAESVYDTNITSLTNETMRDDGGYSLYSGEIWAARSGMPTARHSLAAVEANQKIYAIGGSDSGGICNRVEAYDPAADTWTTKANMPIPIEALATAAVNGKIYAIGGAADGSVYSNVQQYNPATNTWSLKTNMPTPRAYLAAAAVNGKIYVMGGVGFDGSFLNTVEEYDPATDTWTAKANMPATKSHLTAAAVNGKIYVIGGSGSSGRLNTVEEYNPATDTWTIKASMYNPRTALATAVVSGKIYAIGGYGGGRLNTVEEYDPAANTWTAKASMLIPRGDLAATSVNGKIYAIGGSGVSGHLNIVQEFGLELSDLHQYQYDDNNCLDYIITPVGQTIDYQYDNNGNLIRRMLIQ